MALVDGHSRVAGTDGAVLACFCLSGSVAGSKSARLAEVPSIRVAWMPAEGAVTLFNHAVAAGEPGVAAGGAGAGWAGAGAARLSSAGIGCDGGTGGAVGVVRILFMAAVMSGRSYRSVRAARVLIRSFLASLVKLLAKV